ncbi:helix-turn-helix transcriptional regulator [Clostridium perfringens]|uniref:helix-turn-helix transcriptional regulator n=1 Tax=Clostridium perfringens TaxID=1502 RepID=UPI000F548ADF|nr:helix-turn-helix transcriptional regulator [Clostridium perfringens]EJT6171156.1 helix-turn-helix transcriptional regulator [Clostridium perfringens]EJT6541882.1 helix-turn-helix transcriptional regulator [Clostridium perfringens]EJT6566889.1 helix-turn-helix transcriptional regulator [Clostridium perfringens]MBS5994377.1 helix-turn-helix transcriptional regulator [Clostridium perfringens]MDM0997461.1 helix-turn-helix transcriptional regulator [Clostridium perfringens]
MNFTVYQRQKVRTAFESILRADYISINDINQLKKLESYYVDFYNNINSLMQKQDNYICGRRGTGKTALLMRGYYECLKTISSKLDSKSEILMDERILPIYIDLSNCSDIFNYNEDIEKYFIKEIITSLKKQLNVMFQETELVRFKNSNSDLGDLEYIEKVLVNGLGGIEQIEFKYSNLDNEKQFSLGIQEFLDKIEKIRINAGISSIYVFLDEFSDLNIKEQKKLSKVIKKFLGSKINMYFKIGVITDRFDFGDKIRIGRDLFTIPLDLNDFVERYGGAVQAIKKMQEFMELLIERRMAIFSPELSYENIFKVKKEKIYYRLARQAMGVPRTIGLILQNAWIQCESGCNKDRRIGLQELNYGIRATRKIYFKQFQGSMKSKLIPGFNMDLWSDILEKAISEKNKHPDRPASHILIDPIRKDYLNILCENFLVHFIEEGRSSKYGGNYNLYSIDYDICMDNKIKYAEDKDEFTAIRFIYDSIISKYDGYFTKDKIKSYKCPECGKIYDEQDVHMFKVKRCFNDDNLLEEIIHKETPKTHGNFAEVEIKILGLISMLKKDEAMSAQEIADAVGCSIQKVSIWGSKVLYKNGLINKNENNGKNYYYGI